MAIDLTLLYLLEVASMIVGLPLTFTGAKLGESYTAAVYEHAVHIPWDSLILPVPRFVAVWNMMKNIRVYEEQTAIAAEKGADIIVFPEDGVYGMIFNRDTIKPFLEEIPDPREVSWTPCSLPETVPDIDVQRKLSCMARDNSIYVVANMGDRKPCNQSKDPKCPSDGQYQFNTDVVFDPAGSLVARYHKRHLFNEGQFDTPDLEVITFNTPFGIFGLFTCFDILFYSPAVELVRDKGVKNIIFPTAWMDRLPFLAAIQFHSSFAKGLGINVLSANIHFPVYKFHGSGIYTPTGSVNYYYDDDVFSGGKLLISDVNSLTDSSSNVSLNEQPRKTYERYMEQALKSSFQQTERYYRKHNTSSSLSKGHMNIFNARRKTVSKYHLQEPFPGQVTTLSTLPWENYTFVPLTAPTGTTHACKDRVCCKVEYTKDAASSPTDFFVLAAFSGFDDGRFTEVCAVLKCPDDTLQTCGSSVRNSDTNFDFMELSGNFSTVYIFPEVLVADGHFIGLVQGEWTYSHGRLLGEKGFSQPLLTASLFVRKYSRDNVTIT